MERLIISSKDFCIKETLDCGQLFRYKEKDGVYSVISKDKRAFISQSEQDIILETDDKAYFENYFDLNTDYGKIKERLKDKPLMKEAVSFAGGIRILKQDLFETVISFIISANNHIPRIKSIIERLCEALGEEKDGFYAFPKPSRMAEKNADFYFKLGAGYRADYLADTARKIDSGFDINAVFEMDLEEASKHLQKLKGVGEKVADCILLFGAGKTQAFPVDTWIKKVYSDIFKDAVTNKQMRQKLMSLYGSDSGYAQQYLYYYKRENK